jgi:hypothetical protein
VLSVVVFLVVLIAQAESPRASQMNVTIPQSVGGWSLSGPPQRVEPKAIFDYMDGAWKLYLGYRFKFLDVYEYKSPSQEEIVVELYWMETSDDAWGLLSGDWGGEAIDLASVPGRGAPAGVRALYGAGLLRIWSGDLYARVLAYQETDASRQAVIAIGKAISAGRPEPPTPRLTRALPPTVGPQFTLRTDRIVYLRSHLVLNSVYFLSAENLLDLGLKCEMAVGSYRGVSGSNSIKPVHVLLVLYPDDGTARTALAHFQHVYLHVESHPAENRGMVSIEDGWTGYSLSGRGLALVFEVPDETSTRLFLEASKRALDGVEALHE